LLRPSLVLYAALADHEVPAQSLVALLSSNGLIGRALSEHKFLAGDRFFQSISFLGCSPSIALQPQQGEVYLRIEISSFVRPVLFCAPRAHTPLCRHCGRPFLEDWPLRINQSTDGNMVCKSCDLPNRIEQLNFRRRACYSRSVVAFSPVFESEAVPSEQLMQALQSEFATPFRYAYI